MKVLFIEARAKLDYAPLAKLVLEKLAKYASVGLIATVQHLDGLKQISDYLKEHGKRVAVGKPGQHCKYAGQVLGCDTDSANHLDVDAFVFVGDGRFHPLAVATRTKTMERPILARSKGAPCVQEPFVLDKPVFVADPFSKVIRQISEDEIKLFLRKKAMRAARVKSAKRIGILVSTKPGQEKMKLAKQIKLKLEKQGKEAFIFLGDTIDPASMQNFLDVDAWINTACPRMADDDFGKPIANFYEI